MVNVFSIPAFFIVLREVLEACLVVGIVLAYLSKVGATQYNKWVWWGTGAGIGISLAVGIAFGVVFHVNGNQIFSGKTEKIFEGITFLIAAALLTWMIIWMMVMGKTLRQKMEQQVEDIVESDDKSPFRRKLSIFLMVFVQVLREGIETVIFIIGSVNADDDPDAWRAVPLPGILAIIVGVGVSFLVFKGLVQLDIIKFFYLSGIILMAFAAGLVSHAFHELQEVNWFGPWEGPNGEDVVRDWYNATMWSTKGCCHDKENEFFAMLRALFGYQDTPTFIEWSTYFGYWLIVFVIFVVINWGMIRASRTKTGSIAQTLSCWSLLFTFVAWIFTLINVTWIGVLSMTLGLLFSIVSVYILFDTTSRLIKPFKSSRKMITLVTGIAWGALTFFMFVMHIVQMECEGEEGECSWDDNFFFFFGLIFNPDFNDKGRQEKSWPAIAVLAVSVVVTVYFFGALSFTMILSSFNMDGQGDYIYDDAIAVKDREDSEETPEPVPEPVPEPLSV